MSFCVDLKNITFFRNLFFKFGQDLRDFVLKNIYKKKYTFSNLFEQGKSKAFSWEVKILFVKGEKITFENFQNNINFWKI